MASPIKKRALDPKSKGKDYLDKEGECYTGQEIVEVEFEGHTPEFSDFNGILTLLKQLFLKANVNLSDLTNVIINQEDLGSVIKQSHSFDMPEEDDEEEEDEAIVFGITTVINFSEFKDHTCVKELQTLLQDLSLEHGSEECKALVNSFQTSGKTIGLLLNERFINISAKIVCPLLQALRKEMSEKIQKPNFKNIDYYIMICKIYKTSEPSTKVKNGKNNKLNQINLTDVVWSNPEEEIFDEAADYKFEFCVQADVDSGLGGQWMENDDTLTPYRRVLIFNGEKFDQVILKTLSIIES